MGQINEKAADGLIVFGLKYSSIDQATGALSIARCSFKKCQEDVSLGKYESLDQAIEAFYERRKRRQVHDFFVRDKRNRGKLIFNRYYSSLSSASEDLEIDKEDLGKIIISWMDKEIRSYEDLNRQVATYYFSKLFPSITVNYVGSHYDHREELNGWVEVVGDFDERLLFVTSDCDIRKMIRISFSKLREVWQNRGQLSLFADEDPIQKLLPFVEKSNYQLSLLADSEQ